MNIWLGLTLTLLAVVSAWSAWALLTWRGETDDELERWIDEGRG